MSNWNPWAGRIGVLLVLAGSVALAGCTTPSLFEGTPVGDSAADLEADLEAADRAAKTTEAADEASPDSADEAAGQADDAGEDRKEAAAGAEAGDDPGDEPGDTPRETAAPPPASEPTEVAVTEPEPAKDPQRFIGLTAAGGELGGAYQLVALRTGEHEGWTRIVWEFESESGLTPKYEAVEEAEGEGARIRLRLSDVYGYDFVGSMSADTPDSGVVEGVRLGASQDDALMAFEVLLERPARYAVVVLDDPTRVVLDVYED